MGARGPSPKPARLKILNGSAEHDPGRLPKNPALPADRDPVMPEDMAPEAKAVWRATLANQASGVILAAHAPILRVYCEAVVRYVEAQRLLAETGLMVRSRGELKKSPLHQVVRDNANLVRLFARELGLSPSAVNLVEGLARAGSAADPMAALMVSRRRDGATDPMAEIIARRNRAAAR